MKFLRDIFQDIGGSYSSKRTAFFILLALFVICTMLTFFRFVQKEIVSSVLSYDTDLLKWLGGFIAAEQATRFAPKKEA